MVNGSRGGEATRAEPRSTGNDDWLISLGNHGYRRRHGGGSSGRLLGSLTRLGIPSAEEVSDHSLRLLVNKTEMLFDVAWPLALMVT